MTVFAFCPSAGSSTFIVSMPGKCSGGEIARNFQFRKDSLRNCPFQAKSRARNDRIG